MTPQKRKKKGKLRKGRVALALLALVLLLAGGITAWNALSQIDALRANPSEYTPMIIETAKEYDLDPDLVLAVVETESSFVPDVVSSVGARGLMQITEPTFDWLAGRLGEEGKYRHEDLADPALGVRYGCVLLRYLMDDFDGETATVLAAYHAGINITHQWLENPAYSSDGRTLDTIPYEDTAYYVDKVLRIYQRNQKQ